MGIFPKIDWFYKFQEKQEGRSKVTTYPGATYDNWKFVFFQLMV